jgi:hypothetical protein
MVMLLRDFCLVSLCWLVGDYLLLRDFGPYGIFIMCVFTTLDFLVFLDGKFTSLALKYVYVGQTG